METAVARKKKKNKRVSYLHLIVMMLPGLIYLVINNYLPMFGITIAFKNLDYQKEFLEVTGVDLRILNICLKQKMLLL